VSLRLVFWRESYRARGNCSAQTAAARLRAMLSNPTRYAADETLLGRMDGMRFRIWKRSVLGTSADTVQLEGSIAQTPEGALIEGTYGYKAATKLQFIGMLALGIFIAASGAVQRFAGNPHGNDVIVLGGLIAGITAVWILGGYWMRGRQIAFLSSRVEALLAPEVDTGVAAVDRTAFRVSG